MTTTAGVLVRLVPVSHIELQEIDAVVEAEFRERGEPLNTPTYEAEVAGGGVQVFEHDEESIVYPLSLALKETDGDQEAAEKLAAERTAEATAEWEAHIDARARLDEEINRRKGMFLFDEGVANDASGECWDGKVPDGWVKRRKRHGFDVPDDPLDLRLSYIMRGLLVTPLDQKEAAVRIMALTATGVNNAKVTAALDFFRLSVDGQAPAQGTEAKEQPGSLDDEQPGGGG